MSQTFVTANRVLSLAYWGVLGLTLVSHVHAAGPAMDSACGDNGGSSVYGPAYSEQAEPLFERFICQMSIAKLAKPLESLGPPERIEFSQPADIGFQPLAGAMLVDVPGGMELVDTVNFNEPPKIDFTTFNNLAQAASLIVGNAAVWMVTPGGARIFDAKTQRWSFSAKLSSDVVRPKDIIVDDKSGNAWFFGRDLYQYEIATHNVFRYKSPSRPFRVIRKLAVVAGDLWLATDGGVFYLDTKRKTLMQLRTADKLPTQLFTQVAANKNEAWFGTGEAHLMRIVRNGQDLSAQISKPIAKLATIEWLARDDGLWMLHSQDQGRSYQLAIVSPGDLQLSHSKNTLYNLRESDGQVLASAYDKLFKVDTAKRTLSPIQADVASIGALSLGNRVMFSGVSYVNSLGTGSVSRYVLDLSKGWQQPTSRLMIETWGLNQSTEMFTWSPALIETGANAREIWFLIAGNIQDARSDRNFAVRYDRRSARAQVFFSRWKQDVSESRPFKVDSMATTVGVRPQ